MQGLPASWWNHLHNQHHAKPNCFHKDPDLNMHPLLFSLGKTLSKEVCKSTFSDRKLECDMYLIYKNDNPICALKQTGF